MRMTFSDDHEQSEGVPFPEEALKLTERGPDGVQSMADWTRKFQKSIGDEILGWAMPRAARDIINTLEQDGPYFDGVMLALPGESPERCASRLSWYVKHASCFAHRDPLDAFRQGAREALEDARAGRRRDTSDFDLPVRHSREERQDAPGCTGSCSLADAANRSLWGIGLFLLGAFCGLALHGCTA